jgi:hypothetical protein
MAGHVSPDRIDRARSYSPPPAPAPKPPTATGPNGREIVDKHTRGDKTDVKAVAQDLRQEIRERPQEATKLVMNALEQVKADDRDELAQEFIRAHSDEELKALGQTEAGKGALALSVNELAKGKVHKDEAEDAKRVGNALGTEIDLKVNTGWARVSGIVHTVLDFAGFIPGLGAIPDLINAGIYAAEGDFKNAALSATAAIPIAGDGAKATVMVARHADEVIAVGSQVARHGDEVVDAGRLVTRNADEVATAGKKSDDVADAATPARGANAPNVSVTHNGYGYKTDAQGRVTSVSGDLNLNKAQGRNQRAQLDAGGADRLPTDQGGHFVGRRFDGPTQEINHFAQNGNFNMGAYRSLENKWDKLLQEGHDVRVQITPKYSGDSLRPESMKVKYWVDGVPQDPITFKNAPGGK